MVRRTSIAFAENEKDCKHHKHGGSNQDCDDSAVWGGLDCVDDVGHTPVNEHPDCNERGLDREMGA